MIPDINEAQLRRCLELGMTTDDIAELIKLSQRAGAAAGETAEAVVDRLLFPPQQITPPEPLVPQEDDQDESESCGFTGQFFGARYPDAICIDGFLWDLDSCEVPGGPLFIGGEDPCPVCQRKAAIERLAYDLRHGEYHKSAPHPRRRTSVTRSWRKANRMAALRIKLFVRFSEQRWNDGRKFGEGI